MDFWYKVFRITYHFKNWGLDKLDHLFMGVIILFFAPIINFYSLPKCFICITGFLIGFGWEFFQKITKKGTFSISDGIITCFPSIYFYIVTL